MNACATTTRSADAGIRLLCALMLFLGVQAVACGSEPPGGCAAAAAKFLKTPDEQALAALSSSGGDDACWPLIGEPNAQLNGLRRHVEKGNKVAAAYLASHLSRLDGGNLEDALVSLGQFGARNMTELLELAQTGELTETNLSDALVMLPLALSDQPAAQLAAMKRRRVMVERVARQDLARFKAVAVGAIDRSILEIQESMGTIEIPSSIRSR